MNTRRLSRWLILLALTITTLLPRQFAHADYDQDAEIQRLIDMATEEKRKAEVDLQQLKAKREQFKLLFIDLNTNQKRIADLLYRVRLADAKNRAVLQFKTSLNFLAVKGAWDIAHAKVAAAVTDVVVMIASDYLSNHYAELFDARARQLTLVFSDNGVKAVEKLNWLLSLDDTALSGMIRNETPALSGDRGLRDIMTGGKLSDDLIALKRAEYILKAGTDAEKAIEALKQDLLKRQALILKAIAGLEHIVKMRDEDIRSWQRNRDVGRGLRSVPPLPQPQPVAYNIGASLDFGTAAGQMRDALDQLKANNVDCKGYATLVNNADAAAWKRLYELFLRQVWPACSGKWSSDACRAASQRFDSTVQQDYNTQLGNARRWINEQFANEKPRVGAFLEKLKRWREQEITTPYFGHMKTVPFQPGNGNDPTQAVWGNSEIALPASSLDEYWNDMRLPLGAPPLLEIINQRWTAANEHVRDLDHDLSLAHGAHNQINAAASDATDLAGEWEPNLYFWSCVGALGPDQDEAILRSLKRFKPAYEGGAAAGAEDARRYVQAARERQSKLGALASAYRAETSLLRTQGETLQIRDKLLDLQRQGVGIGSPGLGYALWRMMTSAGVTEAMVKELAEVVPGLGNEEFALKYMLEIQAGQDPKRKPVLAPAALATLRDNLKSNAAFLVPIYNDYQSLHGRLRHKQAELDAAYRNLRNAVEGILGEPVDYLSAPQYLDPRHFVDANDFPDPTAGVFEQLDQYEKLAAEYHAAIDPLHPASFHLVAPMRELAGKLERERGGLMGRNESGFVQGINEFSVEAEKLMRMALRSGGKPGPQALFGKARMKLMSLITEISGAYTQGRKIAELTRQLKQLITGVTHFLAHPESEGGPNTALTWISATDEALAPGGEAGRYRSNGGINSQLDQLATLRDQLRAYQSGSGDAVVRKLYQDFAAAYQARNLNSLLRHMTADWKAADGSDLRDLEDILDNSFRVFDRIQFGISGLSIQQMGQGLYRLSYTATITGLINQMNLKHQESAQIEDSVTLTPDGPKIQSTRGGRLWLQ
ncbi:MAG: hypothetical protein Q8O33_05395 [Pseudomonadota bacterium]|nr:hypothetical protein [Pseudomonadota bacterium]